MVMVGKEKDTESYQLLINNNYISVEYNQELYGEHNNFLNNVCIKFAEKISKQKSSLELGVLNGFKINEQGVTKIERLDSKLFENLLIKKLKQLPKGAAAIMPIAEIIN